MKESTVTLPQQTTTLGTSEQDNLERSRRYVTEVTYPNPSD
jgi:hypothetical protein